MLTSKVTRPMRKAAGALVLVGAVVASTPGTASAGAPERFEFDNTEEFDFPVCGLLTHVTSREVGKGTIRVRQGQSYVSVNWSGHNTLTNAATGQSVELYADFRDKDSKITDNGDGTLTIAYKTNINERDYAPDGTLGFKTSGTFEFVAVIDTMGTPDNLDDDVTISDDFVRSSGRDDRDDADFCAWFEDVTS